TAATWSAALPAATTGRAINKLATIRADLVSNDVADEGCGPAIAQTITLQLITSLTATLAAACSACFKIKDLTINTSLQIRVLPLRYIRNRDHALRQTVKI